MKACKRYNAIYAQKRRENDRVINNKQIGSVAKVDFFTDDKINSYIQSCCKCVLNKSRHLTMLDMCVDPNTGIYRFGDYVYGEYGMLLCIVNRCQILWEKQGDNNNVHTDQQYSKLVQSSVNNQLVFVHNHPGGGGLSWKDLKNLIQTDQIQAAVVITNHGRTFIMGKTSRFNSYIALNKYYELTRNRQISDQDRVSEFLKQLYSMGLEYMTN